MKDKSIKLKDYALTAPLLPGVYIFKDIDNKPIYIGKAKNIRNRVLSYFLQLNIKNNNIIKKAKKIEFLVLKSEEEALILEADLIKFHKPKYNIRLKDDKHLPYIRINRKEKWPTVEIVRKIKKDKAIYFGPYIKPKSLKITLSIAKKNFKYRNCKASLPKNACLEFYIGLCSAPCINKISNFEYKKSINNLIKFLSGKIYSLIKDYKSLMNKYSDEEVFEEADKIKNKIIALENSIIGQRKIFNDGINRDVVACSVKKKKACCFVMQIREGRLQSTFPIFFEIPGNSERKEIFERFIVDFYRSRILPDEILLSSDIVLSDVFENWLSSLKKNKVIIKHPSNKTEIEAIEEVEKQARNNLIPVDQYFNPILKDLLITLNLKEIPKLIYIFDISHTSFKEIKGSQVCYKNGSTNKKYYRQYNISDNSDDLAAMSDMSYRCFSNIMKKEIPKPDLILIDGGIEQLKSVANSLGKFKLDIELISIAKRFEKLYFLDGKILSLPKDSLVLLFLKKIRDESHRFGITQHRKARRKRNKNSLFLSIPGVGEKTAKLLRRKFSSFKKLQNSSSKELIEIKGIGKVFAGKIIKYVSHIHRD